MQREDNIMISAKSCIYHGDSQLVRGRRPFRCHSLMTTGGADTRCDTPVAAVVSRSDAVSKTTFILVGFTI